LTSQADSLTFKSDSEAYDVPSELPLIQRHPKLIRANTLGRSDSRTLGRSNSNPLKRGDSNPIKRSDSNPIKRNDSSASKWGGYGWGLGKAKRAKEIEAEMLEKAGSVHSSTATAASPPHTASLPSHTSPPPTSPPPTQPPTRNSSKSSNTKSHNTRQTHSTTLNTGSPSSRRPQLATNDSSSTLVGSAYDRKVNDVESIKSKVDTSDRLDELRKLMLKDNLDY
jgi:Xaa-Pro aminopeptidase